MKKIIFLQDVRICTGIVWHQIKAGTIAICNEMLGADAAEVTCKNSHGETISFVETFIGKQIGQLPMVSRFCEE